MKTLGLFLALAAVGHAQWPPRGTIASATGYNSGVSYRFATVIEPASSGRQWADVMGEGIQSRDGGQHRFLWDARNHLYFGYDLGAERADSSGKCRVTFFPLSLKVEDILPAGMTNRAAYQVLSLPTYPMPQEIRASEPIFQSEQVWNLYVQAEPPSPSGMGAAFGASSWPALTHAR
jgi:hypothetical protein